MTNPRPQPAPVTPLSVDDRACGCADPAREAFFGWVSRLVHDHRGRLLQIARHEGLSPEDAFDVVQEAFQTFLTLPAAQALVDRRDDSRKLLVVVTRNLARNRRRLASRTRPHDGDDATLDALPEPSPGVEALLAEAEDLVHLRGCVQALGDLQRLVVTLRMLDEADGLDVARTLEMTPGHVAVLLHRAKANLRACMTSAGA